MPIVTLAPPSWTSGELLSAQKLNLLAQNINAVKGVSAAPTGTFRTTINPETGFTAKYWSRRNYRYLHIRYTYEGGNAMSIRINGNQEYSGTTSGAQWRTFDLDAITTVPELYAFYEIQMIRASGRDLTIHEIMESGSSSPTTWGTYDTPDDWTGEETAAQYLSKLQSLSTAVTSMTPVMVPPAPGNLWSEATQIYWIRRKRSAISFWYEGDTGGDITVLVNGETIHSGGSNGTDVVIAYSAMTDVPAVGEFFSFEFRVNSGTPLLRTVEEYGAPSAVYAPSIAHGSLTHDEEDYTAMVFTLNTAQDILFNAGWQYACVDRPDGIEHPRWSFRKTARYLHYKRDGSTTAYIFDPAEVEENVTLTRTGNNFTSIDLDTIDWLLPGGLAYAWKCDAIWLDDRP